MGVATQAQVDDLVIGGVKKKFNQIIIDQNKTLDSSMKAIMARIGARLADELEKNAPVSSGGLVSNIQVLEVKETKSGYRVEIVLGKDYTDYVDKGVRGIQNRRKTLPNKDGRHYQFKTYGMPLEALKSLEGWMRNKNMETTATNLINRNDEGRTMLPQISTPVKRLAYFIKKYGIEASNYQGKSIEKVLPDFNIDIQEIGYNSLILKVSK
jgi:hypothetical protein